MFPDGTNGESGVTEFIEKCENCGRLTNMLFGKHIACNIRCAEAL